MTKVVGIRFKDTGKTYYFDPKGLEIKKGDLVVVETARGMECGVAQYAPKEVAENEVTAPLKPVLRIATARDKQILEENKEKGPIRIVCPGKVYRRDEDATHSHQFMQKVL